MSIFLDEPKSTDQTVHHHSLELRKTEKVRETAKSATCSFYNHLPKQGGCPHCLEDNVVWENEKASFLHFSTTAKFMLIYELQLPYGMR